jgi:hypothetical protein
MQGYNSEFLSLDLKSGSSPAPLDIALISSTLGDDSDVPAEPATPTEPESTTLSTARKSPAKVKTLPPVQEARVKTAANEVPLQAVLGALRVKRSPQNAMVTLQSPANKEPRLITDDALELIEGEYTLLASAPGYSRLTVPVKVESGKTNEIELKLQPLPDYERDWKTAWNPPGGWIPEGDWVVRTGGNFVFSTVPPKAGTLLFSLWRKSKTAQWVINYRDERNYDHFELDRKNFIRTLVRDGKKSKPVKVAHQLDKQTEFQVQITFSKDAVTHRLFDGKTWKVLDECRYGQPVDTLGKFGFVVPGRDQIGLSTFSFKPL